MRARERLKKKPKAVYAGQAVRALRTRVPVALADLIAIWRARDSSRWATSPELYQLLGEKILEEGEPLLAYDIITEGLKNCPTNVRLRQLQGLALARGGAIERASLILQQLRDEDHFDEETLGMLARTYKDRATSAPDSQETRHYLTQAAELYGEAHKLSGGCWTGINAATTSLLTGNMKRAAKLAREVRASCLRDLQNTRGDKYWLLATLAEASLVLRDWAQAQEWYRQAGQIGRGRFGDLQSSRRNARFVLNCWKAHPFDIDRYLKIPPIALFAGHMIDRPGRARPRFPTELEPIVAQAIREKIKASEVAIGYSSGACGSDILFLEAMLDVGGEIVLVLPCAREHFIRDSVDLVAGSKWSARFERVVKRATRVIAASIHRLDIGGVSFEYADQLILGLARIRASELGTGLAPLAVWDGLAGDDSGGTASVVKRWRNLGLNCEIINPLNLLKDTRTRSPADKITTGKSSRPKAGRAKRVSPLFRSRIMSMLFADAVSFSRLTEEQVPRFVEHFLGSIAQLIAKSPRKVLAKNTWGDGLYLVFAELEAAGKFALDLCDLITGTEWKRRGLPEGLGMRIALHAGPVYEFHDPVTGKRSYTGTHVSRAARIEPITPPGYVYASETFAALAAAQRAVSFELEYVGQTPMAKGYGTFRTYHVRRGSAPRAHVFRRVGVELCR